MREILRGFKRKIGALFLGRSAQRHALVGDPKLWRLKRDFQIGFLTSHGLRRDHRLLDVGCGTLRGGMPIIEFLDPGGYTGLEVRPNVLAEARRELEEAQLEHKEPNLLLVAEASSLPDDRFDVAWAFSVFIHMDDDTLARTLSLVSRCLAKTGTLFANVNIGEGERAGWQGFPVVRRSVDFYREVGECAGLTVEDLGELGSLGHVTGISSQDEQHMLRFSQYG